MVYLGYTARVRPVQVLFILPLSRVLLSLIRRRRPAFEAAKKALAGFPTAAEKLSRRGRRRLYSSGLFGGNRSEAGCNVVFESAA
jgi:hypothetical protein